MEDELADQLARSNVPPPERQFRGIPGRRFRFDFAWPAQRVAVEVDGGIWIGGRHARGSGIEGDAAKLSLAAAHGWRVLRVTRRLIESGEAVALIEQALAYDSTTTVS